MTTLRQRRAARAEDLGLSRGEYATLARLKTPQKIQVFLNAIPCNFEIGGETVLSVREVLRQRRAHCIEGAFVAAAALWVQGEPPLLLHLDCVLGDTPHVIAAYRRGKYWGAISKTNGYPLRFRDPVYRNLRELALSYFHEYYDKRGNKTLRSYAQPFDMRRVDPALWITSERNCWQAHDRLADLKHRPLFPARQVKFLAKRDPFERKVAQNAEYPRPIIGNKINK
jgi:hypothetical protein